MRLRIINIEGEADPATVAAIRAALDAAPGAVHIVASAGLPPKPTIGSIINRVAFETGVSRSVIVGPYRGKGAVRARTAVAWAAYALLDLRQSVIGMAIGNRNPTTISTAFLRACRLIEVDPAFRRLTDRLRDYVKGARP